MILFTRIARWWRLRQPPKPFVQGMTLKPGESAFIPFTDLLEHSDLTAEEMAKFLRAAEEGRLTVTNGPIRRVE